MNRIPVQDEIYRSRLTIKYRTNIDGVPVQQELPLRLLVLGDLTGGKPVKDPAFAAAHPTPPLTYDRLLPNRRIVSILHGMRVDDIIEEMNVAFPIPRSDDPVLGLLRARSFVAGKFGGEGAAPLVASLKDIESDGSIVIKGTVPFSAIVQENSEVALRGSLEVAMRVAFQAVTVAAKTTVDLTGMVDVPLADTSKLDAVVVASIAADPKDAKKLIVKLTSAKAQVLHADDPDNAAPWVSAPIDADAELSGPTPAKGAEGGFVATGIVSIAVEGKKYPLTVTAKLPLKVDSSGEFSADPTPAVAASYALSGSLTIAVKTSAPVALKDLFDAAAGDPISLPVQREGTCLKELAPAGKIKLQNDDTTPKSDKDKAPQKMPAYSVEGTLSGKLKASLANILGTQDRRSLESGKEVSFEFPIQVSFTTAGKTTYPSLIGKVMEAKETVKLEVDELYGRIWGKKDELAKDAVPVRPEDVVVDVDAKDVDVSACRVNLELDPSKNVRVAVVLAGPCGAYRCMRIRDLDSFTPDAVAASVPEIRRLQIINDLLVQLKSDVDLIPDVRNAIAALLAKAGTHIEVLRGRFGEEYQDRLMTGVAALIINDREIGGATLPSQIGERIDAVVARIKEAVNRCVSFVLMDDQFQSLERNWRDVAALCKAVQTDKTIIDLLDLGTRELVDDMKEHASDIFTSELFKRLYLEEYDRYGGKPFGAMIGLYYADNNVEDIETLTTLSEIANAAHCPFVAGVKPTFFGDDIETWADLDSVGDIEAHLSLPKFGKWNTLRDSDEAPYIGLTLPGYLSREPWGAKEKQLGNQINHDETLRNVASSYLWGNSAILFAQNLVRSFESSGWCQYVRGVNGGGLIQGMTVHNVKRHGKEETQSPVEFEIADYRELQFSKAGLIPLVHCKGSSDAAFFSAQSLKKPRDFRSEIDTQNAYLVTNLAYTFSITRIAHYVKRMMRDYIGSKADAAYIQQVLQPWLNDYITTTVNPDELTLRDYPFKAVGVSVVPKPGPLGWYKAIISILPHIQFEGMDVELRLEAALGGK